LPRILSNKPTNKRENDMSKFQPAPTRMKRKRLRLILALLIALLPASTITDVVAPVLGIEPCPHEDSNNGERDNRVGGPCLWDASERGNGVGASYIAFPDGTFFAID